MPSIALICASPPGPNPGMHSVDLAFAAVQRNLPTQTQVRYLVLYEPQKVAHGWHPVRYEQMLGVDNALSECDAVVFWGDFLHAFRYRRSVMDILQQRSLARDEAHAAELVSRHLFLAEANEQLFARTILFGQTLIFNRQADYIADPSYAVELERLLCGARAVWMRDVYSAMKASRVRSQSRCGHLGVDCAMLLQQQDIDRLPGTDWLSDRPDAQAGVYFGRSGKHVRKLADFASRLCRALDVHAEWLPWGHSSNFDDRSHAMRRQRNVRYEADEHPPSLGDLLRRLRSYQFVITDTYHLALNAWRMGVPAICIGKAVCTDAWSVSSGKAYAWRDKRQVFYSMYDAMDYYVYGEEIMDRRWRPRRIYHLTQLLGDNRIASAITQQMLNHRDMAMRELTDELLSLVSG